MRRLDLRTLIVAGLFLVAGEAVAGHVVVLVAHIDSPILDVSSLELRKIYLGITVRHNNRVIRGLRNKTDSQLNRIFLQDVVAMSERSYERRLLSFTLKYGRPRPAEVGDHKALVDALSHDLYAVTYMWQEEDRKSVV